VYILDPASTCLDAILASVSPLTSLKKVCIPREGRTASPTVIKTIKLNLTTTNTKWIKSEKLKLTVWAS
jgi:hypothetical protein